MADILSGPDAVGMFVRACQFLKITPAGDVVSHPGRSGELPIVAANFKLNGEAAVNEAVRSKVGTVLREVSGYQAIVAYVS